ncbi:MAG: hypothetical protein PUB18_04975 [bacterium]|nr:hypothetical protein [bacterium]
MKTRIIIIIFATLVGLVMIYFITNPKVEQWEYKSLPNQYIIKKTSETNIRLGKKINQKFITQSQEKEIGVEDYIAEFSYGKKYIALKCLANKNDSIDIIFYLVDTKNEDVYGPYNTESTYEKVKQEIVDDELGNWIPTITKPKDAK